MHELDKKYQSELESIKESIQKSEELKTYLESEEDEDYKALQDKFEPEIAALHKEVVENYPLQTIALEKEILEPELEGLFIPRILGYSVLRGELNEDMKYERPQNHFRRILKVICNSANFDLIKQRIGQSVQMGFALSSDIWVTGFISDIDNKKIRTYLQNLLSTRFRDPEIRRGAYERYARQFSSMNFLTVDIPTSKAELTNRINNLVQFLVSRDESGLSHASYEKELKDLIVQKDVHQTREFVKLATTLLKLEHVSEDIKSAVAEVINDLRKNYERFDEIYFELLEDRLMELSNVDVEFDRAMVGILDKSVKDDMLKFYQLMDVMHSKGYIHEDTIEDVRKFYNAHEGLSTINQCLRLTVSGYFAQLLNNLGVEDFRDYFELSKTFDIYINLFANEAFNQRVKRANLSYIKRLIKHYTDKRSKDYQEIKKFVSIAFVDMGFLTEKEVVELFKTRRKRKPKTD